jgi:hypothetical protein
MAGLEGEEFSKSMDSQSVKLLADVLEGGGRTKGRDDLVGVGGTDEYNGCLVTFSTKSFHIVHNEIRLKTGMADEDGIRLEGTCYWICSYHIALPSHVAPNRIGVYWSN